MRPAPGPKDARRRTARAGEGRPQGHFRTSSIEPISPETASPTEDPVLRRIAVILACLAVPALADPDAIRAPDAPGMAGRIRALQERIEAGAAGRETLARRIHDLRLRLEDGRDRDGPADPSPDSKDTE